MLETAIAASNAQFEEPDILKRLDVRLLEISPGDLGWDVFSLDYHVDGPIGTVSVVLLYLLKDGYLKASLALICDCFVSVCSGSFTTNYIKQQISSLKYHSWLDSVS